MKTRTVSGIMSTLLLTSILTLTFNIRSVSAGIYPAIYIEPATTVTPDFSPGMNYTISIKTDYDGWDVTSYQITLSYNPSILRGVEVVNGDLIVGDEVYFKPRFIAGDFNNTEGKLSLTVGYFYVEGAVRNGPGTLANVTFTVVGYGTSNITLGPETKLIGWDDWLTPPDYPIIDAATMPTHIQHGYFNNVKSIHDVAAISFVAPTTVIVGQLISNIKVIVANEGKFTETFKVTAYTETSLVGTQTSITLTSGERTTLTFDWDTTDLSEGNCTITAEAILDGDADPTNNYATTTVIVGPGGLDPVSPGFYETSEYLMGSVAVGVILPESNGTMDPSTEDWTTTEEAEVIGEIRAGLDWWATYNPSAHVSFSMEVHYRVPTSYEPISRPSWDEWLWMIEAMTYLGYPHAHHPDPIRDYVNDLRAQLSTNWAFAIFVVDSSNDYDGKFANGLYAYACLGGPFFVMTYDNGVKGGIKKMDRLTAHEMGHIFYATDEYNGRREYSGYLNVSDIDYSMCMMNVERLWLCEGTKGQIGWRDTDGDGILDIVDTVPDTTLNPYLPDPTCNRTLKYTGSVTVAAYPNRNPFGTRRNVTINTIANVEYRIDNGPWMNATPTDGAFDEAQEDFRFATPSLSTGVHMVEVRGTNSVGNVETSYASDIVTIALEVSAMNVYPCTLNSRSIRLWIMACIELPEGYYVSDIDVSTISIDGSVPAEWSKVIGNVLMVKFDGQAVIEYIRSVLGVTNGKVILTITGELSDGTLFIGSRKITVISPPTG